MYYRESDVIPMIICNRSENLNVGRKAVYEMRAVPKKPDLT